MVKRSAWKMNRLESLVLLQMDLRGGDIWLCPQRHAALVRETCDSGYRDVQLWIQRHAALDTETCGSGYRDAADCGRRYLDIKNKRRWGYTKQVRLCPVNSDP